MTDRTSDLPPGSVRGRLVDLDGAPVVAGRVHVDERRTGSGWRTVEAAAGGSFVVTGLAPDPRTTLWCDGDGCARLRLEHVAVFPVRENDLGDLALAPGCRLRVRAVGASDRPLVGAALRLQPYFRQLAHTGHPDGPPREATAGEDGIVELTGLSPGPQQFELRAPGHRHVRVDCDVPWPDTPLDLGRRVLPAGPLRRVGRVVDQHERPLAGAVVHAHDDPDHTAVTDADGRFELSCMAADARFLAVRYRGWTTSQHVGGKTVRLHVAEMPPVRGVAVDAANGAPVAIEEVWFGRVRHFTDGTKTVSYGACESWSAEGEGRFRVETHLPGEHELRIEAAGYEPGIVQVIVPAQGELPAVEVRLAATVPGAASSRDCSEQVVQPELHPSEAACAIVWATLADHGAPNMGVRRGAIAPIVAVADFAFLREDGRFHLRCRGGEWVTREEPGGRRTWCRATERGFEPAPTGAIAGRVEDFAPASRGHLWVVAFRDDPVFAEARVAVDGTFLLRDLPVGRWGLRVGDGALSFLAEAKRLHLDDHAHASDYWPGAVVVDVAAGTTIPDVVLRLPKPGRRGSRPERSRGKLERR